MTDDKLTIYDVLRTLVDKVPVWNHEGEKRRYMEAIQRAEQNEVFRTEGRMQL